MDALELALRCSSLLLRTMGKPTQAADSASGAASGGGAAAIGVGQADTIAEDVNILTESDLDSRSGKT
jgi:hypothetical protein